MTNLQEVKIRLMGGNPQEIHCVGCKYLDKKKDEELCMACGTEAQRLMNEIEKTVRT
jgi:rRNA maturation endonuclease Nob1